MAYSIQRLPLDNIQPGVSVVFLSSTGAVPELITVLRVTQTAVVCMAPNLAGQLFECRFRKGDGTEFGVGRGARRIFATTPEGMELVRREPRRQELIERFGRHQWFAMSVDELEAANAAILGRP